MGGLCDVVSVGPLTICWEVPSRESQRPCAMRCMISLKMVPADVWPSFAVHFGRETRPTTGFNAGVYALRRAE